MGTWTHTHFQKVIQILSHLKFSVLTKILLDVSGAVCVCFRYQPYDKLRPRVWCRCEALGAVCLLHIVNSNLHVLDATTRYEL